MKILIVAGGTGTRLWPASRKSKPKQLLKLINYKTLLQNTYQRFAGYCKPSDIYLATTTNYADSIKQQLPKIPKQNFSIEPVLRDRGPAIGLASLIIHTRSPDSIMTTAWSDSHISPTKAYLQTLRQGERFLKKNPDSILVMGIRPTFAHTGMGHIKLDGRAQSVPGMRLFRVESFKEKPDLKTAQKFTASGRYLWNTGIFMWRSSYLLSLYKQHLPEVYDILEKIKPALGTPRQQAAIHRYYPSMRKVDIETGIMEKLHGNLFAIEAPFHWMDIGSWKAIKDIQAPGNTNAVIGRVAHLDTKNSLIYNYSPGQLVVTLGLQDVVAVVTKEAVLIVHKDRSEDLKQLIKLLEANKKYSSFL